MKRLLAYLFIVLGLGLVFNSKSFSISFHDIESLKIGVIQKKTDKFKYVFASSSYKIGKFDKIGYYAGRVKIKKNGDLKGKIFFFPHKGYINPSSYECSLKTKLKNSDTGDIYLRCVNGWYKGNFINDNLKFQTTSVKLLDTNSGFENFFIENLKLNFIPNYKDLKSTRDSFLNTKTQIAKAEPSQTQKVAKINLYNFCKDKGGKYAEVLVFVIQLTSCPSHMYKYEDSKTFINEVLTKPLLNLQDDKIYPYSTNYDFKGNFEYVVKLFKLNNIDLDPLIVTMSENTIFSNADIEYAKKYINYKDKTQIAKAEPSQKQTIASNEYPDKSIKLSEEANKGDVYKYLVTNLTNSTKWFESTNSKKSIAESEALNECRNYYQTNNSDSCLVNSISIINLKKNSLIKQYFVWEDQKKKFYKNSKTQIAKAELSKKQEAKIYKAKSYGDKTGKGKNQLFLGVSDNSMDDAIKIALNNCKKKIYGNNICKIYSTTPENVEIFDPNSIAALIDKSKIETAKNSTTQVVSKDNSLLSSLTLSEEDALKAQIFGCWSIPLGLPYDEDLLVRIKLELKPDGSIRTIEILDHERLNQPGQRFYKVLAESALRAVNLCQPLRVPSSDYERWKTLVLNFDAREMLDGGISSSSDTQIAKKEPTKTPKKKVEVAKVEEPKKEEFKPKKSDQDNDAPVIEIAQNITVDSQVYILKGKVKDKSQIYLTIDGRRVQVKKGKFELERFNIDPDVVEEVKIVAIDKWNNRAEKTIKITIDLKSTDTAKVYENLNPNKVKAKIDNNKIAIIIGIEKYENLTNLDAKYANRDAKAFRAYATRALGIKPSNIKMLIDDKAKRGNTLEAFKIWLPKIAGKGGKDIHIFFAGHGLASENGKDLYVLPQDGNAKLLDDTAITRLELISLIQKVNPKSVTMFFDTCYSGQTRDEKMLVASLLRPIQIITEEQDTPDNFTIFSASDYDQVSGGIEEAQHGMFSYYLMKGLEGNADENKDKKITNGELIAYLQDNVSQEAFTQNREQDPMLSGDPDKVLISYR